MKCPFCGGEMRPGALHSYQKLTTGLQLEWAPFTREAADPPSGRWDRNEAVFLNGTLGGDSWKEMIFGSNLLTEAWLCPDCGKALSVFQAQEGPANLLPDGPDGLFPTEADIMKEMRAAGTGEKPEPESEHVFKPEPKARPGRDPWDTGGRFKRKKDKPDWER